MIKVIEFVEVNNVEIASEKKYYYYNGDCKIYECVKEIDRPDLHSNLLVLKSLDIPIRKCDCIQISQDLVEILSPNSNVCELVISAYVANIVKNGQVVGTAICRRDGKGWVISEIN